MLLVTDSIQHMTRVLYQGISESIFNIGGQVIRSVKCADGLALMAKEETVPGGTIDRLIEIGGCS
jgi:hypothetical protein